MNGMITGIKRFERLKTPELPLRTVKHSSR